MKKILLPLIGLAALAACTKSEVQYEPAGEIGFAPVASNVTKSVAGYNDDTFDGVFPTSRILYVFANASNDEGTAWTEEYFKNAQFEWTTAKNESTIDDVAKGGAYAGNPARYWPNVKLLKFAGYSEACNVTTLTTKPTMNFTSNTLAITGYIQDNKKTDEGANDLMWFPSTDAYTKQANEVPVKMKHACSWITINVYGDDITATYTTGEGESAVNHTGWTLKSLSVKGLVHTGSVECGETAASWTIANEAETKDETYYSSAAGEAFTKVPIEYAATKNNFIVIPQTPTTLDVTYTYTSDATNNLNFTETKNVSLSYGKDNDGNELKWQSGVHYIYNVKITATEILIDPVVVDWDVYDADSNTTDVDDPVNVGI